MSNGSQNSSHPPSLGPVFPIPQIQFRKPQTVIYRLHKLKSELAFQDCHFRRPHIR